jgi:redox-sensitive bicupin YhaK (pirin superfamily)
MGKYNLAENSGVLNVIAGNFLGIEGPASTFTPIEMYDIRLNENASLNLSLPEQYNTSVLIIEGEVMVNNKKVDENHLVLFQNNGTDFEISAKTKSIILLLSGEPINEPIFQYGPFLMNTRQEIEEAMDEFNSGKFGHLED